MSPAEPAVDTVTALVNIGATPAHARRLIADAGCGPLIILSDRAGRAPAAAAILAAGDPGRGVAPIVEAAPAGPHWTVGEIVDRVITPSRFTADGRRHIVISAADRMPKAVADRLLKTVEEASDSVRFWLCTNHAGLLPATMRGRAARMLTLAEPGDRGGDRLPAVWAGPLRKMAEGDPNMAAVMGRYKSATPAELDAASFCHDLDTLARALTASRPIREDAPPATWQHLTPAARAAARDLARHAAERWQRQIAGTIDRADTPGALRNAERRLQALDDMLAELDLNAAPSIAIPALLARGWPVEVP